jgi:hypothetical protein
VIFYKGFSVIANYKENRIANFAAKRKTAQGHFLTVGKRAAGARRPGLACNAFEPGLFTFCLQFIHNLSINPV